MDCSCNIEITSELMNSCKFAVEKELWKYLSGCGKRLLNAVNAKDRCRKNLTLFGTKLFDFYFCGMYFGDGWQLKNVFCGY